RRGHRLRSRVARWAALRAAAHTLALQRDLAVLQDQEPGRAPAGHVVLETETEVAPLKGQVRERTGVRWERPHRVAAPADAHRPDLVLVAGGRRLVLGRRVRDGWSSGSATARFTPPPRDGRRRRWVGTPGPPRS